MPELHWLGDQDAKRAARRVPYRLLNPVETVGDPTAGNWLIQGDNLEALKALLPFYAGRVKCIYIELPRALVVRWQIHFQAPLLSAAW